MEKIPISGVPLRSTALAKAEQSKTQDDDEGTYGADKAIDFSYGTVAKAVADANGEIWMKFTLSNVQCIHQVIQEDNTGSTFEECTCSGQSCDAISLKISEAAGSADDIPSTCGDTIKLEKLDGTYLEVSVLRVDVRVGKIGT